MKIKRSSICFALAALALLAVLVIRKVQNNHFWPDEPEQRVTLQQPGGTETAPASEPPSVDEQDYVISLVGDCTLASPQFIDRTEHRSIEYHIQQDYGYPFSNTKEFFESDDLTLANLECVLSDVNLSSYEQFSFRAPTAYADIMTQGGVDFVTVANNHLADFGSAGEEFTYMALDEHALPYGKDGESKLITTDSGLRVGIYCAYNHLNPDVGQAEAAIRQLRADGAEYVICAFHWGKELVYAPFDSQVELAHRCIDAGADLIYGSHSHCLQPLEVYNDAYILYSIGNWSFGGNTSPTDMDTAIFQVKVMRDLDGSISNAGFEIIPCCVSSRPVLEGYDGFAYNDYCPTPYEPGTALYDRAMSKILGTYEGPDGNVDYSNWINSYG